MPEDVVYTCAKCSSVHPAPWELAVKEEMATGFSLILAALWNSKCAQHLVKAQADSQVRLWAEVMLFWGEGDVLFRKCVNRSKIKGCQSEAHR